MRAWPASLGSELSSWDCARTPTMHSAAVNKTETRRGAEQTTGSLTPIMSLTDSDGGALARKEPIVFDGSRRGPLELERLVFPTRERRFTFTDREPCVKWDFREDLCIGRAWPADLESRDRRRQTQADLLSV